METIYVRLVETLGDYSRLHKREVSKEYVSLMMQADYITIEGATLKKKYVEVLADGSVSFYGIFIEKDRGYVPLKERQ